MNTLEFQSLVIDWLTFNTLLFLIIVVVQVVFYFKKSKL